MCACVCACLIACVRACLRAGLCVCVANQRLGMVWEWARHDCDRHPDRGHVASRPRAGSPRVCCAAGTSGAPGTARHLSRPRRLPRDHCRGADAALGMRQTPWTGPPVQLGHTSRCGTRAVGAASLARALADTRFEAAPDMRSLQSPSCLARRARGATDNQTESAAFYPMKVLRIPLWKALGAWPFSDILQELRLMESMVRGTEAVHASKRCRPVL